MVWRISQSEKPSGSTGFGEFKYSHHPVYEGGQLGLAAYTSVAFWNPYNVPISSEEIFIEVPIEVGMQSVNAKTL